jgi:hypothetical protein
LPPEPISSTLKMEAICSSETSVETQRTTRRHIPEDNNLQYQGTSTDVVNGVRVSNCPVYTNIYKKTKARQDNMEEDLEEDPDKPWMMIYSEHTTNRKKNDVELGQNPDHKQKRLN